MGRRGRVFLWCGLAAVSVSAYALAPRLLRFEPVDAVVTRGHPYDAIGWGEPIDFRYTRGARTYKVDGAKVPPSLHLTWVAGSPLPIYCHRWLPHWWRWDDLPPGVLQRCDAFLGLALVFALLIVRDAAKVGGGGHGTGPPDREPPGPA